MDSHRTELDSEHLLDSAREALRSFDGERVVAGKRYNLSTAEPIAYRLTVRTALPPTDDADAVEQAGASLINAVRRDYIEGCDAESPCSLIIEEIIDDGPVAAFTDDDGAYTEPAYSYGREHLTEVQLRVAVNNRFEDTVKGSLDTMYASHKACGATHSLESVLLRLFGCKRIGGACDPRARVAVRVGTVWVPLAFVRLDVLMRKRGGRYFVYTETTAPFEGPTLGFYGQGEGFGKLGNPFPPYLVESEFLDEVEYGAIDGALPLSDTPSVLSLVLTDDEARETARVLSNEMGAGNYRFRETPTAASFYPIAFDDARILARGWLSEEEFEKAFDGSDRRNQSVTVKISSNAKHLLSERANASGESFSEVVEAALRAYLEASDSDND